MDVEKVRVEVQRQQQQPAPGKATYLFEQALADLEAAREAATAQRPDTARAKVLVSQLLAWLRSL